MTTATGAHLVFAAGGGCGCGCDTCRGESQLADAVAVAHAAGDVLGRLRPVDANQY